MCVWHIVTSKRWTSSWWDWRCASFYLLVIFFCGHSDRFNTFGDQDIKQNSYQTAHVKALIWRGLQQLVFLFRGRGEVPQEPWAGVEARSNLPLSGEAPARRTGVLCDGSGVLVQADGLEEVIRHEKRQLCRNFDLQLEVGQWRSTVDKC